MALAAQEGICTGISGGGSVAAALKVAQTAPERSSMLADTGERTISIRLIDSIADGSDDQWLAGL